MRDIPKKYSTRDILRLVFRKKGTLLAGAAAFAIVTLALSHLMPLDYTGKAVFEFGLEAAASEISRTSQESFGTIKERLAHDLAGSQAVEQAIRELNLTRGLPHDSEGRLTHAGQISLQKMVERFSADLDVVWEARSKQEDLVSVSFTHGDCELAASLPNALVKSYIDRTYGRIRSGLKQQHDFLQIKVEDANIRLERATRRKIEFETRHAGMMPENPGAFQEKIERAKAELKAVRRSYEIARLQLTRLQALRGQANDTSAEAKTARIVKVTNPEVARLEEVMRDLEDQIDTALTLHHMKEAHPTIRAMRVKLKQTRKRLAETPREITKERVFTTGTELLELSMAAAASRSEAEAAQKDIRRLENLLGEYDKAWANFSPVRQDYLVLLKKAEDCRGESQHWQNRLQNVQITLAAAVDNRLTRLRAIQPARRQVLPSSPSLTSVLALTIFGGLAFGSGLVLLSKALDRTIRTPQEAGEVFGLPVHGVIGEIVTSRQRTRRRLKKWMLTPTVAMVMLASMALACTSTVLRLRYPQGYAKFWQSPYEFLRDGIGSWAGITRVRPGV